MKRWYVVQVYAGYEDAVKADILRQVHKEDLQDYLGEVLVPAAKLKQFFALQDPGDQQLFPGYILVEMESAPETIRLVQKTPRVIRFLGGVEPVPLTQKEVEKIVSQMKGEITVAQSEQEFTVGSEIDISEGPFAGFVGVIDKVDNENKKLTVMVSIFGRMTPVELGFHQVKR
jgi:transcriptional antiterminator NusG